MVVRTTNHRGQITFTNIRHLMENMTLPELHHYEIGLGSATTRTVAQKKLANEYTNRLIEKAEANIIFVDGSIQSGKDNRQTKYGGYGGVLVDKETGITKTQFCDPVKTSDPQEAELHGIHAAIQLANKLYKEQRGYTTILCDCKNAVNYVNNKYQVPWKYSSVYQVIKEELIYNKGEHIKIRWIPGHTNNAYNDKADTLAKIATTLHKNPPVNRSLDGFPIRHFRPSLSTD